MQARILWSMLWRSLLLLPMGVLMGFACVWFPALRAVLALWAGVFLLNGHWLCGAAALAAIVPLIGTRRWLVRKVIDNHAPSGLL